MEKFNVTRPTVHRHLTHLIENNRIEKSGKTNQSKHFLKSSFNKELRYEITQDLSESQIWQDEFSAQAGKLKPQTRIRNCKNAIAEKLRFNQSR